MGWTSSPQWQTRTQMREFLKREYSLIATGGSGRELYGIHVTEGVWVFLIEKSGGCWGFKDMHESMGPLYYGASPALLRKAPPAQEITAIAWRERCNDFSETQKAARALQARQTSFIKNIERRAGHD